MTRYTRYAEQKFDILNKHKVFITKEQVEEALRLPDKSGKKNSYLFAEKDKLRVLYTQVGEVVKVATFFPIK